jgi:YD repeat-containing protein
MKSALIATTALAIIASVPAQAAETITYIYDAQGRLIQTATTGTVNNGNSSGTAYDSAHNRYHYASSLNGAALPPPPPPPANPPPPNQPPIANTDSVNMTKSSTLTLDVIANDVDPEGNYPLVLQSATAQTSGISVSVISSTSIQIQTSLTGGAHSITYIVADSLGATSTGAVNVTVPGGGGGGCPTCR